MAIYIRECSELMLDKSSIGCFGWVQNKKMSIFITDNLERYTWEEGRRCPPRSVRPHTSSGRQQPATPDWSSWWSCGDPTRASRGGVIPALWRPMPSEQPPCLAPSSSPVPGPYAKGPACISGLSTPDAPWAIKLTPFVYYRTFFLRGRKVVTEFSWWEFYGSFIFKLF